MKKITLIHTLTVLAITFTLLTTNAIAFYRNGSMFARYYNNPHNVSSIILSDLKYGDLKISGRKVYGKIKNGSGKRVQMFLTVYFCSNFDEYHSKGTVHITIGPRSEASFSAYLSGDIKRSKSAHHVKWTPYYMKVGNEVVIQIQ